MCVSQRERERKSEQASEREGQNRHPRLCFYMHICVCHSERERKSEQLSALEKTRSVARSVARSFFLSLSDINTHTCIQLYKQSLFSQFLERLREQLSERFFLSLALFFSLSDRDRETLSLLQRQKNSLSHTEREKHLLSDRERGTDSISRKISLN